MTGKTRSCGHGVGAIVVALSVAAWSLAGFANEAAGQAEPTEPIPVGFASTSPFGLVDAGDTAPEVTARALYFRPLAESGAPAPAIVLLHGAGGVMQPRELTYARQFQEDGYAVLVIDAFASRVDRGTGFVERLLEVTEAMILADAYAALRFLDERPEVDGERVALIGFSLGGMISTYALHAQVAERYAPDGERFIAHVAYYAPCIAQFEDGRTTGAPLLMMYGTGDAIVDPERCASVVEDAQSGGSEVQLEVFPGALHQWDGWSRQPWRAPRGLRHCDFSVDPSGTVRDNNSFLTLDGYYSRSLALALCSDSGGYLIGRDDEVRQRSDRLVEDFLTEAFARVPEATSTRDGA